MELYDQVTKMGQKEDVSFVYFDAEGVDSQKGPMQTMTLFILMRHISTIFISWPLQSYYFQTKQCLFLQKNIQSLEIIDVFDKRENRKI